MLECVDSDTHASSQSLLTASNKNEWSIVLAVSLTNESILDYELYNENV